MLWAEFTQNESQYLQEIDRNGLLSRAELRNVSGSFEPNI